MAQEKILLIRMQTVGDVAAIGIPAVKYYQQKYAGSEITFLTHEQGKEVIEAFDKKINVMTLPDNVWPENIIPAMESFLGLAEEIVGVGYAHIINLDTVFMPCFLARFLKDAGENIQGNLMNISVQKLIEQFQQQTLKPEYVQDAKQYMDSTSFTMSTWHTQWWNGATTPEGGYAEYYLSRACGLAGFEYDNSIAIEPAESLDEIKAEKKIIALATQTNAQEQGYPFTKQVKWALEDAGYHVLSTFNSATPVKQQLALLKQADLLVTIPSSTFWFAKAVKCPALTLLGDIPAATLMSEYVIDTPILSEIEADELVAAIQDIVPL